MKLKPIEFSPVTVIIVGAYLLVSFAGSVVRYNRAENARQEQERAERVAEAACAELGPGTWIHPGPPVRVCENGKLVNIGQPQ